MSACDDCGGLLVDGHHPSPVGLRLGCHDYWTDIIALADLLKSDGCSHVVDIYKRGCLEHDVHYRTGKRLDGEPITRAQTDAQLRDFIRVHSPFGRYSLIAATRWLGVRIGGYWAWKRARKA